MKAVRVLVSLFGLILMTSCSWVSSITSKVSGSSATITPEPLALSAELASLKLLENQPINVSGGLPPYSYEVVTGDLQVDSNGNVQSSSPKPAQVKVIDSAGEVAIVNITPTEYDSITGLNVKKLNLSQDQTKAAITVELSANTYTIYVANFNTTTAQFSGLMEVSTISNIPNFNKACSIAQINPSGTKLIFTADTTPSGNENECELWSMDFNGQNAIQLSEELSPVGSGNRSVLSERFTLDGTRVLYLDGEDIHFTDNELALKIVHLDGTNRARLHPPIDSDWGVTAFEEVPGTDRVLFNHNNPSNSNYYRTYTARMDGSDSGALVVASAATGYVGIGSVGTIFQNNTQVFLYDSKNSGHLRTVEVANIDGSGSQVIDTTSGIITVYATSDSGEIVYTTMTYAPNTLQLKRYVPGVGLTTLLTNSGVAIAGIKNGYFYYIDATRKELRRVALDGSGDVLISHSGVIAGSIHNFYIHSNNDVFFISEKDVLNNSDVYRFNFATSTIDKLSTSAYVRTSVGAVWGTRFNLIGTNSLEFRICTGNYTFGGGGTCWVPYTYHVLDMTSNETPVTRSEPAGTTANSFKVRSMSSSEVQLQWGSFGVRIRWFGL